MWAGLLDGADLVSACCSLGGGGVLKQEIECPFWGSMLVSGMVVQQEERPGCSHQVHAENVTAILVMVVVDKEGCHPHCTQCSVLGKSCNHFGM